MVHVRHRHEDNFTVVGNHLAQHRSLSATAIGLAVHIQSLRDGAQVRIQELTRRFPEGEDRISAALNELEAAGYLCRSKYRTPRQRICTRTTYYECPGAKPKPTPKAAAPLRRVSLVKRPKARPRPPLPSISELMHQPAAQLLAGLRSLDPRLTLSVRDIAALAPQLALWLDRAVPPAQVVRTLTSALPVGTIHRPVALLAHRLTEWLPPALPAAPAGPVVVPFQECEGCNRVFRSHEPGCCRDCRPTGS
ncbi:helix-turn-helix domain-containing protein [Streptomyces sp. NPDC000410]|uniref:helix-turn-helix domain-containing protein n=1 Tax=Streptomyces sp. NPDC000410 TaxID=3154254 RepID=UPI00331FB6CC